MVPTKGSEEKKITRHNTGAKDIYLVQGIENISKTFCKPSFLIWGQEVGEIIPFPVRIHSVVPLSKTFVKEAFCLGSSTISIFPNFIFHNFQFPFLHNFYLPSSLIEAIAARHNLGLVHSHKSNKSIKSQSTIRGLHSCVCTLLGPPSTHAKFSELNIHNIMGKWFAKKDF